MRATCVIRTNPSGMKYCYTHDSATVPLRASCAVATETDDERFDRI